MKNNNQRPGIRKNKKILEEDRGQNENNSRRRIRIRIGETVEMHGKERKRKTAGAGGPVKKKIAVSTDQN